MKLKNAIAHVLAAALLLAPMPLTRVLSAAQADRTQNVSGEEEGLRFRLSEGTATIERPAPVSVAPSEPLSKAETRKLLARLPAMFESDTGRENVKLPPQSLPLPSARNVIPAAFAPDSLGAPSQPSRTTAPLDVLRFAPEGEVAVAPNLRVSFSQPMVPVASQEESTTFVPVQLTPQVRGKWRWLGTQTLCFQPEAEGGRFPMATNYTVRVPAGTKSFSGNALPLAKTFTFATLPPQFIKSYPSGNSASRNTLIYLEFNQRIDKDRVLEHIRIQPGNNVRLRAATPDEIAADDNVNDLVKQAQAGSFMVLQPVTPDGGTLNPLPFETKINVIVPAGTPSGEGPRSTLKEQSFAFTTHSALRVIGNTCGNTRRCSPFDDLSIQFSNTLNPEAFGSLQVKVTPEIPGLKINLQGSGIIIEGTKRANTTYTVTLDHSIKDIFNQTLTGKDQITFKVTTAEPIIFGTGEEFQVLEPAAGHHISVYSVNYSRLRVALFKVTPEDWQQFVQFQTRRDGRQPPPGKLVWKDIVHVQGSPDALTETAIDLSPGLVNGIGQVFVQVEPIEKKRAPLRVYAYHPDGRVYSWVQATNIALDAFVDRQTLVAWANSLKDAHPLSGVQIEAIPDGIAGTTGVDGIVRLPFRNQSTVQKQMPLLIARYDGDTAILPQTHPTQYGERAGTWRRTDDASLLKWYVFDDRKLYRPSEQVSIKGWIRQVDLSPTGDTELFTAGRTVSYTLKDSQDNGVLKGSVILNALAGFDLKCQLPPTMDLGFARLEFKIGKDAEFTHRFQVEEFRRPEFEITASTSEAPFFVGSAATATVSASYFAGGGLPDTEVKWTVISSPTNYTPPNREEYTFGRFYPWWGNDIQDAGSNEKEFTGRSDSAGKHSLRIDFDGATPPLPSIVTAQALVQDINRQTLAATATLLVHPAALYVGLKSSRMFVQKGEPFQISAVVTDIDGKAVAGRSIKVRLVRLDYIFEKGEWKQKETGSQEQTIESGADEVKLRLHPNEGGMYRLTADVWDDRGRPNHSDLLLWAAGGKLPPKNAVEQEEVQLVPDRRTYGAGETAEVLVQAPFAPAEGVMTLERSGILRTERFRMEENTYTLRVPIQEAMTPNVHLQVDLAGSESRVDEEGNRRPDLPGRPAFASGTINLEIPPLNRRLSVTAQPRETVLKPGAETVVDVTVKDAQGKGVEGTDTAVVVVDESVLALTGYKLSDPVTVFYDQREDSTDAYHLRSDLKLASVDEVLRVAAAQTVGAGGRGGSLASRSRVSPGKFLELQRIAALSVGAVNTQDAVIVTAGESEAQMTVRTNFNALALFAASLPTDFAGHAQVKVKLPDNLTRYRVMAVSVSGGKLSGTGEATITARQPLMVRPSAPRFLNFGDRAELPVILQNQTNQAMSVSVGIRAVNAVLADGRGRRVNVPPNNRVEVRFPFTTVSSGTVEFQVAAASGAKTDATEVSFPVYTPATSEAFATYGVIDEGAIAQPVAAPHNAIKSFGGLEVSTASTQLQELTDAVIYLTNYPYECSEQIASRIIAISALKDVLTAFNVKELPSPEAMRGAVDRDLKTIKSLQNGDGGFDFWEASNRSVPYLSVHVAHALVRAREKGFLVPDELLNESNKYLEDIERKIPEEYSPESTHAIEAYALYVRWLMKDPDPNSALKLISKAGGVEKLSLESLGWLLPVLADNRASSPEVAAIYRRLNNSVTETADEAHFVDHYSDGAYTILASDRRADGILLEALVRDQPHNDLIPKLVRGLLSHRTQGHWGNTQENVFILLALDRYFRTYENTTPQFVARLWLGDSYAGAETFTGRSASRQQINFPMEQLSNLTANGAADLTISKEGSGRLYFRVGSKYAPASLKLDAASYGLSVSRSYEAIDNPADVSRDKEGVWHIKAGARVRVRLTMGNPARRYHVALIDPLPAGLEALNPEFVTTERLPDESREESIYRGGRGVYDYFWYSRAPWYEHQNLRDDRVEAFTSLLWEGIHEYSYFARATTPGLFVVPPTKAEEMYAPETFGRGHTDFLRVE